MNQSRVIPTSRVIEKLDEHLSKNDYSAAKRHLLYWLSEAEQIGDGKGVLLLCNELMGLCRKLSEEEQALSFAERALNQVEKMGIQDNVGAATTYLNSATVYKAFNKAENAIPLFKKAQSIYEQNLAQEDDRLGGLYNNMALALVDLARFDEAEALYQKAISVMSAIEGKEPEQAITHLNMASAAEARFGIEDGQEIIIQQVEQAMELLESCKDRTDGDYAFACEKCAGVFGYYGYFYYAEQLLQRSRRIYERT